jgi:putative ABC transport system permease protein
MENLRKNVGYSFRMMTKNPGFSIIAIVTLAIGLGLSSTHFSILNAVLINPFSFKEPGRLAVVWETNPRLSSEFRNSNEAAPANLFDWQSQNTSFDELAALSYASMNLTSEQEPERIDGALVSANFFNVFGMPASLGRTFTEEEQNAGHNRVVVISDGLWMRRFGGDPGVVNQTVVLNGANFIVIGVMPPEFELQFPSTRIVDMWIPMVITPAMKTDRKTHYLYVVGRLKRGITLQRAQADMSSVANQLAGQYQDTNGSTGVRLVSLKDEIASGVRLVLLILLGAVGGVLLIACANVANLLLTRNVGRRREIAVRTALGASRRRLIEQLLTEGVILAILGGALGLVFAIGGISLIRTFAPANTPHIKSVVLDFRVVIFTLGVAALTAVIFGLLPALDSSKASLTQYLKDSSRTATHGKSQFHLRSFFVVLQVTLALLLVIGGSLLVRSFINLMNVDPGFTVDNVLTIEVSLPARYAPPAHQTDFYKQITERLGALQRVKSVGVCTAVPLAGNNVTDGFTIIGQPAPLPGEEPEANYRAITPDYFDTLGIRLLRGRGFTDSDDTQALGSVVVNQAFVRQFFANQDPIGQSLTITDDIPGERRIVGVANDVRFFGISSQPQAEMFVPLYQKPYRFVTIVIRTEAGAANSLIPSVRAAVLGIDKDLPIFNVRTMKELMTKSLAQQRFSMLMLLTFAGTAMILAAIGIYGVMAYSVNERAQEIGIRMAVGATQGHILRMVIRQAFQLTAVGIAIGIALGILLTRVMAGMVYGVGTIDLITFVIAPVLLMALALFASYVPARRATAVDAIGVLRSE